MIIRPSEKKRILRVAAWGAGIFLFINILAYIDVVMRARSSYLKGERYLLWYKNPQIKKQYLDNWLKEANAGVKTKNPEERKILFKSFEMQRRMMAEDNDAKNAYFWFKTAIECFQPPRSKFVRLSEEKIKTAEKLWKRAR